MGWLWNSSAPQKEEQQKQTPQPSPNSTQSAPPSKQEEELSAAQRRLKPLTRDEIAEAELQELFTGLSQHESDRSESSTSSSSSSPSTSSTSNSTSTSTSSPSSFLPTLKSGSIFSPTATESPESQPQPKLEPTQAPSTQSSKTLETVYPTTMSCRTAFDYAFFCQSVGGQWVNVYRYGEMRSCSEHWSDFWFCMRTTSYSKEQKEKMIADRYRKKDIKYKIGPSSEDVWELRTEPLYGAFQGDYLALEREMEKAEAAKEDTQKGS